MASFEQAHPKNVPGSLFVDTTCIDCETCYHLGPSLFSEYYDDKSVVSKQPESVLEWQKAKRAIISCPTNSIGVRGAPLEFRLLESGLPLQIADGVYYLGHTSKKSFGASSYLIKRDEGNIMVDSPRYHSMLVKELESMGGVKKMFLTHQDDVADHAHFHSHFQCERILHVDDVTAETKEVEIQLQGKGPVQLDHDLKIIVTPGHTKGHMCLLYKNKFLFTGDHIFVNQVNQTLSASKGVCWYSWSLQLSSVEKLAQETFEWVLPGHGGWGHFPQGTVKQAMTNLIKEMHFKEL